MVRTKGNSKTKTRIARVPSTIQPEDVDPEKFFALKQGATASFRPRTQSDVIRQENVNFRTMKSEYMNNIRQARKQMDPYKTGTSLPICYNTIGPEKILELRPLGRLPPHIVMTLNDHYVQLTKGLMVPEADLYNNGDQPTEEIMPTVLDEREYLRLVKEAEEEEKQKKLQMQCSTSSAVPAINPYSKEYLINGEMIGVFVIYGSGKMARAVCSKTKEVFTANVIPQWKVSKVVDVIQRLQAPTDKSMTADEIRMSEICISKRMEIIQSQERWVIFSPAESTTIHSYASEKLDEITEKDVMDIFKKVVELVRFCHSRKVFVRNFRTRNFYLKKSEEGEWIVRPCNIQDMGCEDEVPDSQFARRYVVAAYMAPEMMTTDGKRCHSHSTETWGLGVLLYILLTGKYPFFDKDMPSLFRSIKFKQHRWPHNFISQRTIAIANSLLEKLPPSRMKLDVLYRKLQQTFQDVRCRSNILLKQQDLVVKTELFDMYYNAYKHRLLPQNVQPIYDEMMTCQKDLPIANELSQRDLRSIEEAIRRTVDAHPTEFQSHVMETRLEQINKVLLAAETKQAKEQRRAPNPCVLKMEHVSNDLLLPSEIYPSSPHYHPSQKPVDWIVYQCLRDANALEFPPVISDGLLKTYPAPVYQNIDIKN
ncbi:CBN-NIPI-3 protein [Caenorhabditis brenneri]|uniref:CBN-NIPI-3 protein n=1 Tax=Caenorhabditis brenneri TaxID=135651 RepID=G0MAT9_CAEBE|nr:CBN-NIPI-3 protein [Caenorhabditis brenneri]